MRRRYDRLVRFLGTSCGRGVLLLGAGALALLYYRIDPGRTAWMPQCVFRSLTGWECPACGGQRALHASLHGEWAAALRYNPFLLVALPYLAAVVFATFGTGRRALRLRAWVRHPWVAGTYAVLFFAWWIVRNTPLWP